MTRLRNIVRLVLTLALALGTEAFADRPVEKKENATHVIIGKVEAVLTHESKYYRDYIVEVRISEVAKGRGLDPGDVFYASCYQRKKGVGGLEADSAGHTSVPKEGQRVKVFVNCHQGKFDGVYPNWYETLP